MPVAVPAELAASDARLSKRPAVPTTQGHTSRSAVALIVLSRGPERLAKSLPIATPHRSSAIHRGATGVQVVSLLQTNTAFVDALPGHSHLTRQWKATHSTLLRAHGLHPVRKNLTLFG